MKAKFVHRCTHVLDKEATIKFYEEALGMKVLREMGPEDGSWANTFMGNDGVPFEIELTWNRGRVDPYENGGKDTHIAFVVDDFDAAHELHEKMGCIIRENPRMGLYFIADPEGQWIEILPARKGEINDGIAQHAALHEFSPSEVLLDIFSLERYPCNAARRFDVLEAHAE